MKIEIITLEEGIKNKWIGGETTQLYIEPIGMSVKEEFDLRISIASVNKGENEFSNFSNYNRYLTVLQGEIDLSQDGKKIKIKELEELRFDGGVKTIGKCANDIMDFNIIWKKKIGEIKINIQKESNKRNSIEVSREVFVFAMEQVKIQIGETEIRLKKNQLLMLKENYLDYCFIEGKCIYGSK